jgi:hypothetical protein
VPIAPDNCRYKINLIIDCKIAIPILTKASAFTSLGKHKHFIQLLLQGTLAEGEGSVHLNSSKDRLYCIKEKYSFSAKSS